MGGFLKGVMPFTRYPYEGERIACNICQGEDTVTICETDRRWKKLKTVACAECGLMRTDPMPTDAELEAYYRSDYRLDYQLAGERPPKYHIVRSSREARGRAKTLQGFLKPGARVLDIGCGTGEFLNIAAEAGSECVGIEPGEAYARFASQEYGLEIINEPWQDADLPDGHFDVITCHQVVEHLRDPMAVFSAMARWLKPDGVLYVSVPDMRANRKPSFERFHFAHIYGFTPQTLQVALGLNGLSPLESNALDGTTALFGKSEDQALSSIAVHDPERAVLLRTTYPDDTVFSHVFGGGYFRDAYRRFTKWRRDTFA